MVVSDVNSPELLDNDLVRKYNITEKTFKKSFLKQLMFEFIFVMLPKKVLYTYLTLALSAFIYKVRNVSFNVKNINVKKISKLLKVTLNNDILLIPYFTYKWIWDESILEQEIIYHDIKFKLKDFLLDSHLFMYHSHAVINIFLNSLPFLYKLKLGFYREKNKIYTKNLFTKNLLYTFS